jgi:hypothetical protein
MTDTNNDLDTDEYLYLLQIPSDFGTNIYEIGRTAGNTVDDLNVFSKGSNIYMYVKVDNCDKRETILFKIFNKKFKLVRSCKYFKGDIKEILNTFIDVSLSDKYIESAFYSCYSCGTSF